MHLSKGFVLYRRKLQKGIFYYAMFRKPDGKYGSGINTGQTTEKAAISWSNSYIQKNGIETAKGLAIHQDKLLLKDLAQNFFSWNGEWATDKKVIGKRLTERQCNQKAQLTNKHIIPILGNGKIIEIKKTTIKTFRNNLFKNGISGSTINQTLSCLKAILEAAEEKEIIPAVPKIERASTRTINPRGILTVEEVKALFAIEWTSYRAYVASHRSTLRGNISTYT